MTLHRRFLAVSGATALYVGVSAAAYSILKPEPKGGGDTASFDGLADNYDSLVNREETFMGLKLLRWWLVRQAKVRSPDGLRSFNGSHCMCTVMLCRQCWQRNVTIMR